MKEKLKAKIEDLEKQKQQYEEAIEDTLEGAISLEKELQEIDITYATEKQKVVSIDENIAIIEARKNNLKEEQEQLEKQKHKIKKQKI